MTPTPVPKPASAAPAAPTVRPKAAPTTGLTALHNADKPSIVTEGFEIRGELHSNGVLHVEGKVSGLLTAHTVHISAGGVVDGELQCTSLSVKGTFVGKAVCEDLSIASTAKLDGDVSYRFITIGAGAVIKGDMHHLA